MCIKNELGTHPCVEVSCPLWFCFKHRGPHRPCPGCYDPHIFLFAFYIVNETSLDIQYSSTIIYYKLDRHDTYNDHKHMIWGPSACPCSTWYSSSQQIHNSLSPWRNSLYPNIKWKHLSINLGLLHVPLVESSCFVDSSIIGSSTTNLLDVGFVVGIFDSSRSCSFIIQALSRNSLFSASLSVIISSDLFVHDSLDLIRWSLMVVAVYGLSNIVVSDVLPRIGRESSQEAVVS